jgi:hypothetical protein
MESPKVALLVVVAPDGFYPRTFEWRGHLVRVSAVEMMYTSGSERRFRVRTVEGPFELGFRVGAGVWCLRRHPGWLGRAWARLHNLPRYPLPAWRRRARRTAGGQGLVQDPIAKGGHDADRLALVR